MFNKLKELVEMDKKVGRDDKLDVVASDFMAADDKAAFLAKPETKTAIDAVFGGELCVMTSFGGSSYPPIVVSPASLFALSLSLSPSLWHQ